LELKKMLEELSTTNNSSSSTSNNNNSSSSDSNSNNNNGHNHTRRGSKFTRSDLAVLNVGKFILIFILFNTLFCSILI